MKTCQYFCLHIKVIRPYTWVSHSSHRKATCCHILKSISFFKKENVFLHYIIRILNNIKSYLSWTSFDSKLLLIHSIKNTLKPLILMCVCLCVCMWCGKIARKKGTDWVSLWGNFCTFSGRTTSYNVFRIDTNLLYIVKKFFVFVVIYTHPHPRGRNPYFLLLLHTTVIMCEEMLSCGKVCDNSDSSFFVCCLFDTQVEYFMKDSF